MTTAFLIACALALQAPSPENRTLKLSDASLERVRAALQQPPSKLALRERPPDFSVSIWERQRVAQLMTPILDFTVTRPLPQTQLFSTSPFGSQPLVSVDLL